MFGPTISLRAERCGSPNRRTGLQLSERSSLPLSLVKLVLCWLDASKCCELGHGGWIAELVGIGLSLVGRTGTFGFR